MEYVFKIDTKLPTLNEYINVERTNRYGAASMKKKATTTCALFALSLLNQLDKTKKHDIACHWVTSSNRMDHDNIAFAIKFILDGLVESNIIAGDGPRFIGAIHHTFDMRKNDYVVVVLRESE